MKFVLTGKCMTSNEKTAFWESLVVLVNLRKNHLMVSKLDYGLCIYCSGERAPKRLTMLTMTLELSERQRQLMANSNDKF